MTINYVERVILTHLNPDGTYTATSHLGDNYFNQCFFLTENPNLVSYDHIGRHALLISVDNQNFILGYYIDEYEEGEYKVYVEGEQLIRYGNGMAVVLGDQGYIGIYAIERKADGTIKKTPKLEYSADDELYASFSSMVLSMSDSSARISIEKDGLGFNQANFSIKGNNTDYGHRASLDVKGTAAGMEAGFGLDVTPGPTRALPKIPIENLPKSMSLKMSYDTPLELLFALFGIPSVSIKIDMNGVFSIATGEGGIGPSIELNPKSNMPITIKSDKVGTASILIAKSGKIQIKSMSGIEISGKSVGLLKTLEDFIDMDYKAHTHPSVMGPTGTPTPPAGIATKTKLTAIRG